MEFFTKFGIVSTFLLDRFSTNKSRLVITVIGCNNEVNTSVNAYDITNVRNITFLDIISYWYVKTRPCGMAPKTSRACAPSAGTSFPTASPSPRCRSLKPCRLRVWSLFRPNANPCSRRSFRNSPPPDERPFTSFIRPKAPCLKPPTGPSSFSRSSYLPYGPRNLLLPGDTRRRCS